jgi:hypothetical protein
MVMSDAEMPKRRPGQHGAVPLSKRTRARILDDLMRRAEAGDAEAAAALVRLSIEIERGSQGAAKNAAEAP